MWSKGMVWGCPRFSDVVQAEFPLSPENLKKWEFFFPVREFIIFTRKSGAFLSFRKKVRKKWQKFWKSQGISWQGKVGTPPRLSEAAFAPYLWQKLPILTVGICLFLGIIQVQIQESALKLPKISLPEVRGWSWSAGICRRQRQPNLK